MLHLLLLVEIVIIDCCIWGMGDMQDGGYTVTKKLNRQATVHGGECCCGGGYGTKKKIKSRSNKYRAKKILCS